MSDLINAITKEVRKNHDYLLELIRQTIRIGSYSGESEEIQLLLQEKMAELGMETRLIKIDPEKLEKYGGFSYDGYPFDRRYILTGVKKGGGTGGGLKGKALILNGHVDIVPPGDPALWDRDPLSGCYEQGKIYGRGSVDMKSGLSAALAAVKILRDIGFNNYGDIIISSVCGEETGGCGAFAAVEDGLTADGCIILEPTKLKICHIQSGCHTFKLKLKGRSAHAAMAYKGINVIDKFYLIYEALKEMDRRRHQRFSGESARFYENPSNIAPFSLGKITAGEWPSSVPDRLEADGRMGIFPGESVGEMHGEFEETVMSAAAADPWLAKNRPVIEWYEGLFEPAVTDIDSDLVKTLAESHYGTFSRDVQFEGAPYGSDMRIFTIYGGIPTVLYGPGDVSLAHTVNENIEMNEVLDAVCSLALMICRWCGGDFRSTGS